MFSCFLFQSLFGLSSIELGISALLNSEELSQSLSRVGSYWLWMEEKFCDSKQIVLVLILVFKWLEINAMS